MAVLRNLSVEPDANCTCASVTPQTQSKVNNKNNRFMLRKDYKFGSKVSLSPPYFAV